MMHFLRNIYSELLGSKYLKNLFILTSGVGVSQLIPLLLLPILTRFFSPEDFGVFALFMAIIQLLAVFSTLRLEMAVVLPKHDKDAAILCLTSFVILFFFTIIQYIILFSFKNHVTSIQWISIHQYGLLVFYLIPLGSFLLGFYNILYSWNNRLELYKNMSYSHITHSFFSTPISLLFYFSNLQSFALILGQLIGRIVACFLLISNLFSQFKFMSLKYVLTKISDLLIEYKKFIIFETPHTILNFLSQKFIIGMFTALFGFVTVGIFDLSDKILGKPLGVISNSFKTVFYKRLTTAKDKLTIFKKSVALMTVICFILIIPFYIIPDSFFIALLGEDWSDVGKYIKLICPLLASRFIFNVVMPSISYTLQNHYLLIWQIIYFISLIFLFWFVRDLPVSKVLLFYACYGGFMYFILGCISFIVLKNNIKN